MFSCKEIARLNSEARDRSLTLLEKVNRSIHLMLCPPCVRHKAQMSTLGDAAQELADGEPRSSETLDDGARNRLREKLRAASQKK